MEALMFYNISFRQPEDGQDIWLLRKDTVIPVPARYHAAGEHYQARFSFLDEESLYNMDGAWAPMEHPENANTFGLSQE